MHENSHIEYPLSFAYIVYDYLNHANVNHDKNNERNAHRKIGQSMIESFQREWPDIIDSFNHRWR